MIDILTYIRGKRKNTSSGWISFNAVCCHNNGHTQDKRGRGGIKTNDQGWSYHCFNCGYTTSFILGRNLTLKAKNLLKWLGLSELEINQINLESIRQRSIYGIITDRQRLANTVADVKFENRELPPFAVLLTDEYPSYTEYIQSRCVPSDYPIMIQPNNDGVHWTRPHVVVPFTYDNNIVGYSCRFLDNRTPKYIHDVQPGYVFGTDLIKSSWQYVIVTEGVFDALSISGLAVLHNDISDQQARLIRNLEREIIVVPDQDKSGTALIDRAVELGWSVSIPDWPKDVKDVNDAVKRFGRLGALITIMQSRETSKLKIELRKKQLVKRL
jgi:hypothetical protein